MLDLREIDKIEVVISSDGKKLWINSEETGCIVRIYEIRKIIIRDDRSEIV